MPPRSSQKGKLRGGLYIERLEKFSTYEMGLQVSRGAYTQIQCCNDHWIFEVTCSPKTDPVVMLV